MLSRMTTNTVSSPARVPSTTLIFMASMAEAAALARTLPHVRVRGVMTIPPADATREENMVYLRKVQALYVDINEKLYDNKLEYISMGMSGDYADAIRAGSNMVRIGSAIFGERKYV